MGSTTSLRATPRLSVPARLRPRCHRPDSQRLKDATHGLASRVELCLSSGNHKPQGQPSNLSSLADEELATKVVTTPIYSLLTSEHDDPRTHSFSKSHYSVKEFRSVDSKRFDDRSTGGGLGALDVQNGTASVACAIDNFTSTKVPWHLSNAYVASLGHRLGRR